VEKGLPPGHNGFPVIVRNVLNDGEAISFGSPGGLDLSPNTTFIFETAVL